MRNRRTAVILPLLAAATLSPAAAQAATSRPADVRSLLQGAHAPASQLRQVGAVTSLGTRFYRFRQEVADVPVLGAETVVTDDRGRAGDLLIDRSRRVRRPLPRRVSRGGAVASARARVGARRLRAPLRAALALLAERARGRLVWRVLVPSRVPFGSFEVLVDARSGRVLRARDLVRRATGSAMIYDTNPVVEQGSRSGLSDGPPNDRDDATLTALRRAVTLLRLSDSTTCLQGTWARATLPGGNVCAAGRNFTSVTRANDDFEALMAYFHADRTQAYIQLLGFRNVMNRQLRIHADESFPDVVDNAFYDPGTKDVSLGVGNTGAGIDSGEDAEVIVHEYGHAVQDDQVPGFGTSLQGRAMGEGFGDYLSAAIAKTFRPRGGFDACLTEWFALGFGDSCLRRVDWNLQAGDVPPDCIDSSDEHCVGESWSGVLWDIRSAIGATTADRLVIQSHFSLTGSADFAEGSRALLSADRQLYGGSHLAFLRNLLVARGFVSRERLDDAPGEATPLSLPASVTGSLGSGGDNDDVYRVGLTAGRGVVIRLRSGVKELDLRLLRPGTTSLSQPGATVAQSATAGSNETIAHVATQSGQHYIDVTRVDGAGSYTLSALPDFDGDARPDSEDNCARASNFGQEDRDGDRVGDRCDSFPDDPANDVDHDGIGANEDNCPRKANPRQADWDDDGRGDVCDRSSRVRMRVRRRGRRIVVIGSLRPKHLRPRAFRLRVLRLACAGGRCRHRTVRVVRARRGRRGRPVLRLRLAPGRYRLRAALRARGYRVTRTRTAGLRVH